LKLVQAQIYASSCRLSPEISPFDLALGLANHIFCNQLVEFIILESGLGQFGPINSTLV
jgi:folylpolyglutamate synthase/dihydropteroate synthase